MKKLLALVLALVMTLGLATVGTNAAFTDEEKIDHTEAVEVMNALGIINGMGDGTFNPDGNVTRAQMAKMVTIALLGDVEVSAFTGTATDLKDVSGHWAEGYIKYCYSQGIISGRGNGIFDPNANVTTAEASKMLLVALGYNADVRGYVGDQWAINVARDAQQRGLYKEIGNLTSNKAMDRDDAAQLIYNTLTANGIKENQSVNKETGAVTLSYEDSNSNLLNDTFDAEKKVGFMTDFTYDSTKKVWSYKIESANNFGASISKDGIGSKTLKSSTDYTDLFGQKVIAIYDDDDYSVVYGIYSDAKVMAEFVTGGIGDLDNAAKTAKINGTKYTFDDASTTNNVYAFGDDATADTNVAALKANDGAWTAKLIDNDDDEKVDAVIYTPMTLTKILYVGSDSFNANGIGSAKQEDYVLYDGFARNDYAWDIAAANSKYGKDTLVKAELQTGTVSGTRTGSEYQLSGSWYKAGTTALTVATLANNDNVEYVAHGNKLYYAKVTEAATTTKDIALVVSAKAGSTNTISNGKPEAKLLFTDGTSKTVTIAKVNGGTATFGDNATAGVGGTNSDIENESGKLVTYRKNSDGNYELTSVSAGNLAGYKGYIDNAQYDSKVIKKTSNDKAVANDAVVFVFTGTVGTALATNDADLFTGKEINNTYGETTFGGASSAVNLWDIENGFSYAKVIVINAAQPTITTGSNYAYLTADTYETVESDKTYTNYKFWDGSAEVTAKEEESGKLSVMKSGALVTYDTTSTDGVIKNVTIVNATTGVVTGWDGSSKIQLDSTNSKVTSDTKLLFIDSDAKKGVAGDVNSIQLGNDLNNDDVPDQANVRYLGATASNVDLLVVDVSNEMKPGPAIILSSSPAKADITAALSSSNDVTVTGNYDFTAGGALDATDIAAGKTVKVTGAVTATIDDVARDMTIAAAATAVTADKPAVVMSSGTVTGMGDIATMLSGATSTSAAIYSIDLSSKMTASSKVKLNSGVWQVIGTPVQYDLIVGNKTTSVTFTIDVDGDTATTTDQSTLTITFGGW